MRDLLHETPPVDHGATEAERRARVALPGDDVEAVRNPYAGRNPQSVLALIRSGSLPPDQEELAREAIALFEGFSGDRLSGGLAPRKPPVLRDGSGILPDVAGNPDRHPALEDALRAMFDD